MKAMILTTFTPDTEKTWKSFQCLGHTCDVTVYDALPHDRHWELVDRARHTRPDVIIFIGAIEKFHGRPVPSVDILGDLNTIAPMVHICGDSGDKAWWPYLDEYHANNCFRVQVGIDGALATPLQTYGEAGMIALTCIDPAWFNVGVLGDWIDRPIRLGMAGGLGHGERQALISNLTGRKLLTWMNSAHGGTYQAMCDFMTTCRFVANSPMNGTGDGYHVKGRVIETGLARAVLVEKWQSPTADWFEAGEDYAVYRTLDDLVALVDRLDKKPQVAEAMAKRLHDKVMANHSPAVFWGKVLERC